MSPIVGSQGAHAAALAAAQGARTAYWCATCKHERHEGVCAAPDGFVVCGCERYVTDLKPPSSLRLQFLAPNPGEAHICSQCGQNSNLLARLPITSLAAGTERKDVDENKVPWIGLCRPCVERLLIGFFRAEAAAQ